MLYGIVSTRGRENVILLRRGNHRGIHSGAMQVSTGKAGWKTVHGWIAGAVLPAVLSEFLLFMLVRTLSADPQGMCGENHGMKRIPGGGAPAVPRTVLVNVTFKE